MPSPAAYRARAAQLRARAAREKDPGHATAVRAMAATFEALAMRAEMARDGRKAVLGKVDEPAFNG